MPNLYIISGSNGSGKTTASHTILPEMLKCEEFINADEIARDLSPFNPEKVAIEAGRIMLSKIARMINGQEDFAFETTLSTKSYVNTIQKAKENGFYITLIFFWLDSEELAIERVHTRVKEGGHNIPENIIKRRYISGIRNLFKLYLPICDYWIMFNNSTPIIKLIAEGNYENVLKIINNSIFSKMKNISDDKK